MIDQYHISFMGGDRHRIKELHDEQFNDVFRSWGIKVKKSGCSRISGINPHTLPKTAWESVGLWC